MLTPEAQRTSQILLDIGAVTINLEGPYVYASGRKSPVYTDCRLLLSYPNERRFVVASYLQRISETGLNFDVIAGTATAGIPYATLIADRMNKPFVYARSKPKSHGLQNQIEGVVNPGQEVAVIEDLVSTGGSSLKTIAALREAGLEANHVFAIMSYGWEEAAENFAAARVRPIVIATFNDLISVAITQERVPEEQKNALLDWVRDPQGWAGRMGFN